MTLLVHCGLKELTKKCFVARAGGWSVYTHFLAVLLIDEYVIALDTEYFSLGDLTGLAMTSLIHCIGLGPAAAPDTPTHETSPHTMTPRIMGNIGSRILGPAFYQISSEQHSRTL